METIKIVIDGVEVETTAGKKILEAALDAGIYIPNLCALQGMKPFGGCKLCQVEVEGNEKPVKACSEPAAEGMIIRSNTPAVNEIRRKALETIFAKHPHVCLTCHRREHCSPGDICLRFAETDEEQCLLCLRNGRCELQMAVDFIGAEGMETPFASKGYAQSNDNPLIVRNNNLCIICGRCIRVCKDVLGTAALAFTKQPGGMAVDYVANKAPLESDCMFCGSCVEVCPTGALLEVSPRKDNRVMCQSACPVGIDAPHFIRLMAEDRTAEALMVVREKVPLARACGYVCHHPCETACRRNKLNTGIAIHSLEKFAARQPANTEPARTPANRSAKKVAILGSGAAGLTAAYYLAKKGHLVTVLESMPQAGGILRANKGLPSEALDADIAEIAALGVQIEAGKAYPPLDKLMEAGYNAVFLAAKPVDASTLAGVKLGRGDTVQVNSADLGTGREGVYAGGEAVNEKVVFIRAVADGRKAARSIDIYLGGNGEIEEILAPAEEQIPNVGPRPEFAKKTRNEEPPEGYSMETAVAEAKRCMNCDLRFRVAGLTKQPAVPVKQRPAPISA